MYEMFWIQMGEWNEYNIVCLNIPVELGFFSV